MGRLPLGVVDGDLNSGGRARRLVLRHLHLQFAVRDLLGMQAPRLQAQQTGQREREGGEAPGFELVEDHSHQAHHGT